MAAATPRWISRLGQDKHYFTRLEPYPSTNLRFAYSKPGLRNGEHNLSRAGFHPIIAPLRRCRQRWVNSVRKDIAWDPGRAPIEAPRAIRSAIRIMMRNPQSLRAFNAALEVSGQFFALLGWIFYPRPDPEFVSRQPQITDFCGYLPLGPARPLGRSERKPDSIRQKRRSAVEVETILAAKGTSVSYVKPDSPISKAVELMHEKRIGSVLIMENEGEQVLGILTERDIISIVAEKSCVALQGTVGDVMTRDVVACTSDCTLDSIISGMTKFNVRHLPVYKDDKLLGMISSRDVMRFRIHQLESSEEPRFHRWFPKGKVFPLDT